MSRLGASYQSAESIAEYIIKKPGVEFEGLFTHYACADEPNTAVTDLQERRFMDLLNRLEKNQTLPGILHVSNSAAALVRPSSYFNMVRIGIALYGLHPSRNRMLNENFSPALSWKSILSQVKDVPPGTGISYGHEYITSKRELIGTIPTGYGDGYRRVKGNNVLVGGKRVPVVGRVCMDYIMVNLDDAPDAKEGDEVVIIGSQNGISITAEEIANRWDTINYEVVCGITARVPRIYFN
jgi:alanine racemase